MSITAKRPWESVCPEIPLTLSYPDGKMAERVCMQAKERPQAVALDFMGSTVTYRRLEVDIRRCAAALRAMGVQPGEAVTLALPNCPQAVALFYAINAVGAVANMIHPLSAEQEIVFYLKEANSRLLFTLDAFCGKVQAILEDTPLTQVVSVSIRDALAFPLSVGYALTEGRKIPPLPSHPAFIGWKAFLKAGKGNDRALAAGRAEDTAVILYSGGTTGKTKGILLTNRNFNALATQIVATNPMFRPGDKMLAAMPVFHGFGLGVCIHSMLASGGRCLLVPRFTPQTLAHILTKKRPAFIAGVPTLYEAMLRQTSLDKADLRFLKGVFSGGDTLTVELKKKLDAFLLSHRSPVTVREGYGTTETVTACCLTPPNRAKEGSIGIPFPDTYIKIVKPNTDEELPYGEEGEILLAGPTVMQGYLGHPEETVEALRQHTDGLTWVYTGDLGTMDNEGYVYFRGRAKRLIVTSGYNVYPNQIENVLDAHPLVQRSCVIGVKDDYRMQRVKAFVLLKPDAPSPTEAEKILREYCSHHIARYACPREFEFRDQLPLTSIGKVHYRQLESE